MIAGRPVAGNHPVAAFICGLYVDNRVAYGFEAADSVRLIVMYALKQRPTLDGGPIETATRRLHSALDRLADALDRRKDADRHQEALMAQLHALGNDRARLAAELDAANSRVAEVAEVGREVTRRLDVAMGTIRDVLATHGG